MVMDELFNVIIIMIEMLCAVMFFETFLPDDDKSLKDKMILYAIMTVIFSSYVKVYSLISLDSFLLKQALCIVIMSIIVKIYYMDKYVKSFLLAFMYQCLVLVADMLTYIVALSLFKSLDVFDQGLNGGAGLLVFLGKMILFMVILVIRRYLSKKPIKSLSDIQWLQRVVFPIITLLMICGLIKNYQISGNVIELRFYFEMEIGLILMNFSVYYIIENIMKREHQISENHMLQMQTQKQMEVYQAMEQNYQNQKSKIHEFNNTISCISSLVRSKDYDKLENYLNQIDLSIQSGRLMFHTNNAIVDAILNLKYYEMVKSQILFVAKINDISNIRIADNDLVVLLSNLLNNAIEACEQCKENRFIKFRMEVENHAVNISIANSKENKVIIKEGILHTTKKEKSENHGLGIKNIIGIVEKYNGIYAFDPDEQEFLFSICIPLKN